jgi:hypothetical protein
LKQDGQKILVYRVKLEIWDVERTVIVFVSEQLKAGQIRGLHQVLAKTEQKLKKIQAALSGPKVKKRDEAKLAEQINRLIKSQKLTKSD